MHAQCIVMYFYLFVNIIDTIKTSNQLLYLSFWYIMLNIKYIIEIKLNNCSKKEFDVGKFTSLYSKVTSVKRSLWVPPAGDCLIQVWLYIWFSGGDLNSFQDIWYFPVSWGQHNPIGSWPTLYLMHHNTLGKKRHLPPYYNSYKHDKSFHLFTCTCNTQI